MHKELRNVSSEIRVTVTNSVHAQAGIIYSKELIEKIRLSLSLTPKTVLCQGKNKMFYI